MLSYLLVRTIELGTWLVFANMVYFYIVNFKLKSVD